MRAFIHTVGGEPFNEGCASAWRGFEALGVEVVPFSTNEVLERAAREDVVVGGLFVCAHALARWGVEPPTIDYPRAMRDYLGREVAEVSAWDIRPEDLPLFVKPVREKELPGTVVHDMEELSPYLGMAGEYPLYASAPVNFVSEWRCFVRLRRIVGARHYAGDPGIQPDWVVCGRAVGDWSWRCPHGYALDVGVTDDGRTLVVEVNDGYALGCYGLDDVAYALLLSARWAQLVGVEDELHDVRSPAAEGPVARAMLSQERTDRFFRLPGPSIPASEPHRRWVWGIAANVRDRPERLTPAQEAHWRAGTKHFAPGARVWVMEPRWSYDGRIAVVGKKRGTHRYIRKVMALDMLREFRAKRCFSPTVISWLRGARLEVRNHGECGRYGLDGGNYFGGGWGKHEAEEFAVWWNEMGADDW